MDISYKDFRGKDQNLSLASGETLYIVGPNGTGKSTFLSHIARACWEKGQKFEYISGFTPEWGDLVVVDIAELERVISKAKETIANTFSNPSDRYSMRYLGNTDEICVTAKMLEVLSSEPLREKCRKLFEELRCFPTIEMTAGNALEAITYTRRSHNSYSMSDGERRILYVASTVFSAPENALILIDYPEMHVNFRMLKCFIEKLIEARKDCIFVFATHDLSLVCSIPGKILLMSCCRWEQDEPFFATDFLENADIPEDVREWIDGQKVAKNFLDKKTKKKRQEIGF